jgi:hypothetical protein
MKNKQIKGDFEMKIEGNENTKKIDEQDKMKVGDD